MNARGPLSADACRNHQEIPGMTGARKNSLDNPSHDGG